MFELSQVDQSGVSKKEHLLQVQRSTGKIPSELDFEPLPEYLYYLWEVFISLSSSRQVGMNGSLSLTFQEISSWSYLNGIELTPKEVEVIKKLDTIYMKVSNG